MKDFDYNELYNIIPKGKENAIHLKKLSERLNKSESATKNIIQKARRKGYQILSGQNGYWFAGSDEEVTAFIDIMQQQAFTRFGSVSTLREDIKDKQNSENKQLSFFDNIHNESEGE
ncbi:MAG: hypothetical protein IJ141_03585 [Lachnospiraceae bacterium]|nr:hypothetical protein [Lachnospiraceae bacterium]MBR1460239.1 hypothetical protein [bacterium]